MDVLPTYATHTPTYIHVLPTYPPIHTYLPTHLLTHHLPTYLPTHPPIFYNLPTFMCHIVVMVSK
jgi:hypothetical protein